MASRHWPAAAALRASASQIASRVRTLHGAGPYVGDQADAPAPLHPQQPPGQARCRRLRKTPTPGLGPPTPTWRAAWRSLANIGSSQLPTFSRAVSLSRWLQVRRIPGPRAPASWCRVPPYATEGARRSAGPVPGRGPSLASASTRSCDVVGGVSRRLFGRCRTTRPNREPSAPCPVPRRARTGCAASHSEPGGSYRSKKRPPERGHPDLPGSDRRFSGRGPWRRPRSGPSVRPGGGDSPPSWRPAIGRPAGREKKRPMRKGPPGCSAEADTPKAAARNLSCHQARQRQASGHAGRSSDCG